MRLWEFDQPQAAGCIIVAADTGRWCLQQRSQQVSDPGIWSTWGGGREPGESLEQCVIRELSEESGYNGPVTLSALSENSRYRTYLALVPHEFRPRLNQESQDYCWVDQGDWPQPLHENLAEVLQHVSRDITVKDIHRMADQKHIAWDNDPEFLDLTQRLTGHRHLDDLNQVQLRSVLAYLQHQPRREQGLTEAFDQPYKLKWYPGDWDEVTAYADIPDGDDLTIIFNNDENEEGEEAWSVEFYRNNSQEITGEGDAQRIFATVLSAIQTFVKKYRPTRIIFSASKEVEPGQKIQSRANLYDRLVQRYARALGYKAFRADAGNKVHYELSKINKGVAEGNKNLKNKGIRQI